jgi:hypothetical protein
MRLECLRRPAGQQGACARFFVFGGRKNAVASFLAGRINNTGLNPAPRFLDGYLPANVSSKLGKIELCHCTNYYRGYFSDFSNIYKSELPRSYRARLVADEIGDDVRVLIWKIGSMGKRTTFDHKKVW